MWHNFACECNNRRVEPDAESDAHLFLSERGLAIATLIAATVQAFVLIGLFSRRGMMVEYGNVGKTISRATIGSILMWLAGSLLLEQLAHEPMLASRTLRVVVPFVASVVVYVGVFAVARGPELSWVLRGKTRPHS